MGAFLCVKSSFLRILCEGGMQLSSENHESRYQLRAAAKAFEWLRRSKPAVAAREQEKMSEGISLPPNERDCGTACSMQGTDRETLNEWCKEHET